MNVDAIVRIGEAWVVCGSSRDDRSPVESAFETKIVVRRRVVYTNSSTAKMKTLFSAVVGFTDAVRKWLSQNVRSGFLPGGGANSGSHFVGGVDTWWNVN